MIFRYFVSDNESKELALRHKYRFTRAKNKRQAIDKIIKLYGYNRVIKDYKAILRHKNNTPYVEHVSRSTVVDYMKLCNDCMNYFEIEYKLASRFIAAKNAKKITLKPYTGQ